MKEDKMKVKTLCVACALLLISSTASAFQVETNGHVVPLFKGYEIQFEYFKKVMTIKCPHDGGLSSFSVAGKQVSLIRTTDTCPHVPVVTSPALTIYKDDIPFLIADDYCGWKKGAKNSAFPETWERYAK
jgi:hypothetical protein